MKRKGVYIAFLILGLLITAVLLAGLRMSRDEERLLRMEYEDLLRQAGRSLSDAVGVFTAEYEKNLVALLDKIPAETSQAREYLRRNPLVDHFFMLDTNGRLSVPNAHNNDLSAGEIRFLDRTREIWDDKRLLSFAKPEVKKSSKFSKTSSKSFFWYPYYWNDGFHVLFAQRNVNGITGFELNSTRLIADLLNALAISSENSERIATLLLKDAMGRVLFQSKGNWNENEGIQVQGTLEEPFASWKVLAIGAAGQQVGRSALLNIISATILFASAIFLLGFFYVRIHRQEIAEASKRVNFVNQVSHELKTPLTNIRMYAELLEQEIPEDNNKATRHLSIIVSESQRLGRLIGNVLTLSGKERGKLSLNRRKVNLKTALLETLEHFTPILHEKGILTQCSIDEESDVFADRDYFQQIVSNLIANVEKYGSAGKFLGIDLKIRGDETTLIVSDRGPGIPPSESKRIFDEFYRVSNKLSDGIAGTGIGLSIVRDLAELHGGAVRLLESKEGAVFEVRLHTPRALEGGQNS